MTYLESRRQSSSSEYRPHSPQAVVNFIAPNESDAKITNISGTFEKLSDPNKGRATIRRKGLKISGLNNRTEMDETLEISYDDMVKTSSWALARVSELQQEGVCFPDEITRDVMDTQNEIVRLIGVGMFLDQLILDKQISRDYK